ncbi:intercellular adhesion molecule 3 [Sorex araneus]|uniref:intercellular adhesion molecule 3 n=1 Tax=Sorex araneus TaxID=42254 RepID=UPI0024338CAC|nr:intercellular adhesion molecule 3 [Sorex araneus]
MVSPGPPQLLSLLVLCCMLTPGIWGQKFQLWVEPQNALVLAGTSILLNCSTDCPQPNKIILETYLSKKMVASSQGWETFELTNVTEDAVVICATRCQQDQITNSSRVVTYGFPASVDLAPLPPWLPVGENLTLSCQVAGGAPRNNLTAVLLRGDEELSRQPVLGVSADVVEVTATVRARREDHGANFSCRTELDLRPLGLGLFENSSAPRKLRTYVLPGNSPRNTVRRYLEVGKLWPVNCSLDGLFPVSEARVQLMLGNQMLHPVVSIQGDTLTAVAMVNESEAQEGAHELVCSVTLGGESRESRENVTFFSKDGFPGPNLTLSESNVPEGTTVNVICAAGPRVRVQLHGLPAAGPGQPIKLQLNATEKDDRRTFFCSAILEVEGETLHKNKSVQLRVLYGPKIDRARCPQRLIWKEETTHVLDCKARGNPDPLLKCSQNRSGHPVPVGTPFFVRLNYSGTYHCQAINSLGTYTLMVEINVQERNPVSVTIILIVLAVLGVATVGAGVAYVSRFQKRSDSYHVKQEGKWLSLPPQSNEAEAEVAV